MENGQGKGTGAGADDAAGPSNVLKLVPEAAPTKAEEASAIMLSAARHIRDTWPAQVEMADQIARVSKMRYDAYIKHGFAHQDALIQSMRWVWS